jgi:RNA polymerase sigma factor (sigma-70 family)
MEPSQGDQVSGLMHLVRPTVWRITRGLDPDHVATGYLALVLAVGTFDPSRGTALADFARFKVERAIFDRLRYERRREHAAIAEEPADPCDMNLALKLDIQRALEALPPRQRLILHLRFWRGIELEDAARQAGCSRSTAVNERRLALTALRERLLPLRRSR